MVSTIFTNIFYDFFFNLQNEKKTFSGPIRFLFQLLKLRKKFVKQIGENRTSQKIPIRKDDVISDHQNDLICYCSFAGMKFVETLIIRENPLLEIPLLFSLIQNLDELKYLHLEENFIQAPIPDTPVKPTNVKAPNIEFLSLRGNPIRKITEDFFKPLAESNLFELDLENCFLESIEPGALHQLTNLRRVDFSMNYKLLQVLIL